MPEARKTSKPKPAPVKNPFMKPEVKIISDDLTNSRRENLEQAVESYRKKDKRPARKSPTVGSVRG